MMLVIESGVHSRRIWVSQLLERVKFEVMLLLNCDSVSLKMFSVERFEKASPSL